MMTCPSCPCFMSSESKNWWNISNECVPSVLVMNSYSCKELYLVTNTVYQGRAPIKFSSLLTSNMDKKKSATQWIALKISYLTKGHCMIGNQYHFLINCFIAFKMNLIAFTASFFKCLRQRLLGVRIRINTVICMVSPPTCMFIEVTSLQCMSILVYHVLMCYNNYRIRISTSACQRN